MSNVGLVSSENTAGEQRRLGATTKTLRHLPADEWSGEQDRGEVLTGRKADLPRGRSAS